MKPEGRTIEKRGLFWMVGYMVLVGIMATYRDRLRG